MIIISYDQCLIFLDLSEQKLNCKEIIEGLAKVLKKHTGQLKCSYYFPLNNLVGDSCLCGKTDFNLIISIISGLRNILPITTAKVPIVKFEHKQSGLEGDISLYNTLVSGRCPHYDCCHVML